MIWGARSEKEVFVIEVKGLADLDVPRKTERLKIWCEDTNKTQNDVRYDFYTSMKEASIHISRRRLSRL